MELVNEFSVPATTDDAWNLLTDISRIAPCLPGATVEPLGDDTYAGTVSVKVGPIKVAYGGEAAFRVLDQDKRRMVLDARGRERSGKGSATAAIAVELHPDGDARTRVHVVTDLQVTGKVAQFGRSAMRDVSARLIDQFADNLAGLLGGPATGAGPVVSPGSERGGDGPDLDVVSLVAPMARRAAVPAATFGLGLVLGAALTRRRSSRISTMRPWPTGYGYS